MATAGYCSATRPPSTCWRSARRRCWSVSAGCSGSPANTRLQALIRQAAGRDGKRQAGWLRLGGAHGGELLVTPVAAEAAYNRAFQRPLVLLTLPQQAVAGPLLAELFGLTPAEQRLV